MEAQTVLEYEWPYLRTFFPAAEDLNASAAAFGAIERRRAVGDAEALLRMALAYGCCGLSLRQTAAWAEASGVASLSDVALLKRLRNASGWLGHLLGGKLAEASRLESGPVGFPLRLIDATTVSAHGSAGTDWRIHLSFNLSALSIDHIELTDQSGGETLTRFPFSAGELIVADRGYAHRAGFHATRMAEADFLVRIPWNTVPLLHRAGEPFDILNEVRSIADARATSFDVLIASDKKRKLPSMPARLVALRKSEAAASQSRRKVLAERSRKGESIDPRTLDAASYVLLLTSTTEERLSAAQALELYRFRWQVEMLFKRLKGLTGLGSMPAKDAGLARSLLYARLLAAVVLDDLTDKFLSFSPWGFRLPQSNRFAVENSTRAH